MTPRRPSPRAEATHIADEQAAEARRAGAPHREPSANLPARRGDGKAAAVRAGLRAFVRRRRTDLLALAGAAVGSLLAALVVLRVWRGDLGDFWEYGHDALFFAMLVKGVLEFGWFLENPNLGAPLGQQLYDIPAVPLETMSVAVLRIEGLFTSDPAIALNVFFLLSFPLVALSSYLVLRVLRLSAAVSLVCSVLFALLPYHFIRGEQHLFLAAYYTVPVSCYLFLQVLRGEPLFARRPESTRRGPLAFASRRSLTTLALCVLVGSTGGYYIAFTLVTLAVATLVALAAHRSRRALAAGAVVTAVVGLTLTVASAPSLLYARDNGRNAATAREPTVTDELGLRIVNLLLPVRDHRLEPLDDLRERVDESGGGEWGAGEGAPASLGLLGSFGFLTLLLVAVVRALRRGDDRDGDDRLGAVAAATVIFFTLATAGGLVALARFWVAPELRAWNRVSVFVAFFALLALGLLLDRLRMHRLLAGRPPVVWAGVLALVLGVGVLDQTNKSFIPDYAEASAVQASDRNFVERIERRLPPGSAVFQLPYVPFFEAQGLEDVDNYELLRPYLHSRSLRWSFGSIKGRPRDWFAAMATLPTNYVLPAVTAAGFNGLVVHSGPYGDRGLDVESEVCRLLNQQRPLTSTDGDLAFFDLRPYGERLRRTHGPAAVASLGEVTVRPVVLRFGAGFNPPEQNGVSRWAWTKRPRAQLNLYNPADRPRGVRLAASVSSGGEADARITYPDGSRQRLSIAGPASVAAFYRDLTLRPGNNFVALETPSSTVAAPGDPRTLYLRLNDPMAVDTALLRFVAPIPGAGAAC